MQSAFGDLFLIKISKVIINKLSKKSQLNLNKERMKNSMISWGLIFTISKKKIVEIYTSEIYLCKEKYEYNVKYYIVPCNDEIEIKIIMHNHALRGFDRVRNIAQ